MELYQLEYFYQAACLGNISAAARELHVTQPSISKAIKALEAELGVTLMEKKGRYCVLTDDGILLQTKVRPVLRDVAEITKSFSHKKISKDIRLNALSANHLLVQAIAQFGDVHPDINFRISEKKDNTDWDFRVQGSLPEMYFYSAEELFEEKLMIAMSVNCPLAHCVHQVQSASAAGTGSAQDIGLATQTFSSARAVSASHPKLTVEDVSAYKFVKFKSRGTIRTITDRVFREIGFNPDYSYECDNIATLQAMVMQGEGLAIWPELSWRRSLDDDVEKMGITLREFDVPNFVRHVYLVKVKDAKLSPETEQFVQFLKEFFAPFR